MCDYDRCYTNRENPALFPKLKLAGIEETVIVDTGVDPRGGRDPPMNQEKERSPKKIVFGERQNVRLMKRVTGTQFG